MLAEQAEGHREHGAWVGDRTRLQALVERIAKTVEAKREENLAEVEADYEKTVAEIDDAEQAAAAEKSLAGRELSSGMVELYTERRERAQEARTQELERVRRYWTPRVTAREKELDYRLVGTADEVVEGLDPRRVDEVSIICPGWPRIVTSPLRCEVSLSRSKGARLYVTGNDRTWVQSTLATVDDQLKREAPGYAWVRHEGVGYAAGIVFVMLAVLQLNPQKLSDVFGWSLVTGLVLVPLAMAIHEALVKRYLLPGLEVLDGTSKPRGARALGWLATVVVSAVLIPVAIAALTQ